MEDLRFKNPEFRPGTNYTVRLGKKWSKLISAGDVVNLPDSNTTAIIECMDVGKLWLIPVYVLKKEHDPSCAFIEGLMETLRNTYPKLRDMPDYQLLDQTVTWIGFVPKETR